jgi:hypothetical protein
VMKMNRVMDLQSTGSAWARTTESGASPPR